MDIFFQKRPVRIDKLDSTIGPNRVIHRRRPFSQQNRRRILPIDDNNGFLETVSDTNLNYRNDDDNRRVVIRNFTAAATSSDKMVEKCDHQKPHEILPPVVAISDDDDSSQKDIEGQNCNSDKAEDHLPTSYLEGDAEEGRNYDYDDNVNCNDCTNESGDFDPPCKDLPDDDDENIPQNGIGCIFPLSEEDFVPDADPEFSYFVSISKIHGNSNFTVRVVA